MNIKKALKALKEAEARLADDNLPPFVLDELLHRTLNDFIDAVLPSGRYANITEQCRAALRAQDYVEFISGISLLRLMLPRKHCRHVLSDPQREGCDVSSQAGRRDYPDP